MTIDNLLNGFKDITVTAMSSFLIFLLFFCFNKRKDIAEIWRWFQNRSRNREEERRVTYENKENIENLNDVITNVYKKIDRITDKINSVENEVEIMKENRSSDWEKSKQIRKSMSTDINTIKDGIDNLSSQLCVMVDQIKSIEEARLKEQEKRKATKRAELKDKIGQSYRYYHQKQEWNYMEEDTLRELIKEYEANDGLNSFVHDKVIPESYTWKLITKEEMENGMN